MRISRLASPLSRQHQVDQHAADAAVAILEWMYGFQPQMGEGGAGQVVGLVRAVEPGDQPIHLARYPRRRRRFVVDFLASRPAADDVHRFGMVSVSAGAHPAHARKPGRKEGRLPGLQPFVRQRRGSMGDRVVHDVEQAIDMPGRNRPPLSAMPSLRATDERTACKSSRSPSMAAVDAASWVQASAASSWRWTRPSAASFPSTMPCARRANTASAAIWTRS
jgi:hypothetical protein